MKPHLKWTPILVIPAPYTAWCFLCDKGFMSLDELTNHNHASVNEHERANAAQAAPTRR